MKLKFFAPFLAGALLPLGLGAQTVLIDANTRNGSFELLDGVADTTKVTHWDTDPAGDVDNWTVWTSVSTAEADSGTEDTGFQTHGDKVAFLQPGNAAYNLTDWTIQAGDEVTYSWDWVRPDRSDAEVGLGYWDSVNEEVVAVAGSTTTNPSLDQVHTGLGMTYTFMAGEDAIGNNLALTVASIGDTWPEVDNFEMTVVPEPSTYAFIFGGLALVGAMIRRRLQKA